MLLSIKMFLSSVVDRQSSGCRSKQWRDRLIDRRKSTGSQSIKARPKRSAFSFAGRSSTSSPKSERLKFVIVIFCE